MLGAASRKGSRPSRNGGPDENFQRFEEPLWPGLVLGPEERGEPVTGVRRRLRRVVCHARPLGEREATGWPHYGCDGTLECRTIEFTTDSNVSPRELDTDGRADAGEKTADDNDAAGTADFAGSSRPFRCEGTYPNLDARAIFAERDCGCRARVRASEKQDDVGILISARERRSLAQPEGRFAIVMRKPPWRRADSRYRREDFATARAKSVEGRGGMATPPMALGKKWWRKKRSVSARASARRLDSARKRPGAQ